MIAILKNYIKFGKYEDYIDDIPDSSIDLILTDPPYLISKRSNFNVGGAWNNSSDKRCRKTPPKTDFGNWDKESFDLNRMFKTFYKKLRKGGTLICFYDIWKISEMKNGLEQNNFKQFRLCRWDKTNPVPVNSKLNYLSNASEYFVTAVKGGKPTFNSEYDKGIYQFPICSGKERTLHPTQKPLALIDELIKKHSNPGDTVLDPFLGSGTTAVAAIKNGRHYIGFEKEKDYFDIANNRIRMDIFYSQEKGSA